MPSDSGSSESEEGDFGYWSSAMKRSEEVGHGDFGYWSSAMKESEEVGHHEARK